MKWPMTESAKRALRQAAVLARQTQSPLIEPLHLLGALLLQESRAAEVLERFGITPLTLADDFPGSLREDDFFPPTAGLHAEGEDVHEFPAEEACSVALRSVLWEAGARFQRGPASVPGELGSEHLLWALTRVSSPAAQFLERHGLNRESLEAQTASPVEPLPVDFTIHWQSDEEESQEVSPPRKQNPPEEEGADKQGAQSSGQSSLSPPADSAAQMDVFRILDAAANRAREGLRVLEDEARFHRNDAMLTEELKNFRHALQEALHSLPGQELLAARDTPRDVGTRITTESEQSRQSFRDILQANCRRVQEALRSLEEYGKLVSPDFARRCEALRYRFYSVEEMVSRVSRSIERLEAARLCLLLTRSLCRLDPEETLQQALAGGVDMVQIREKELSDRDLLSWARTVRDITRYFPALLIINDRPDLAVACEADGVHLGQDDFPPREARRLLGGERILGISTHHIAQLDEAVRNGADYLGVGPVFPSQTKDFSDLAGLNYVREAAGRTALPWFAIGGIDLENVEQVVQAGARRLAVSGAICRSEKPAEIARRLKEKLMQQQGKPGKETF